MEPGMKDKGIDFCFGKGDRSNCMGRWNALLHHRFAFSWGSRQSLAHVSLSNYRMQLKVCSGNY